jgi:hypothetical protein
MHLELYGVYILVDHVLFHLESLQDNDRELYDLFLVYMLPIQLHYMFVLALPFLRLSLAFFGVTQYERKQTALLWGEPASAIELPRLFLVLRPEKINWVNVGIVNSLR